MAGDRQADGALRAAVGSPILDRVDFLVGLFVDGLLRRRAERLRRWRADRRMSLSGSCRIVEIRTPAATLGWAVPGHYLRGALEQLQAADPGKSHRNADLTG